MGPEGERALAELAERLHATYPYSEPALRRPDAEAAASDRLGGLRGDDAPEPEQPRARRRPGDLRAGAGGGRGGSRRWSALDEPLGHLTSSGTVANLEALWIARELHPDRAIVSGENAHYTHARVCAR